MLSISFNNPQPLSIFVNAMIFFLFLLISSNFYRKYALTVNICLLPSEQKVIKWLLYPLLVVFINNKIQITHTGKEFMNSSREAQSSSSQQFEYLPHSQGIRSPKPDTPVSFGSKIHTQQKQSSQKTEDKTQIDRQHLEKQLHEQQTYNIELTQKYQNLKTLHDLDKQSNIFYSKLYSQIVVILNKPDLEPQHLPKQIKQLVDQNNELFEEVKKIGEKLRISEKKSENKGIDDKKQVQYIKICEQKDKIIRDLRLQLLQSTQNNINSIFSTQLTTTQQQKIAQDISEVKKKLNNIERQRNHPQYEHRCYHKDQLNLLIKNYQQMLKQYQKNQRIVQQLEHRQDQFHKYFTTLKADLQQSFSNSIPSKTQQLQKIIHNMLDKLQPTSHLYLQNQENRIRIFLRQIQQLNDRLIQKQAELENVKCARDRLEQQLANIKKVYSIGKSQMLEAEIRMKEKRIAELENTIIDHIGSRATSISVNSQQSDRQKQINNIRNLKAIVKDLKEKNKILQDKLLLKTSTFAMSNTNKYPEALPKKLKLPNSNNNTTVAPKPNNNLTSTSENMLSGVERVTKDEQVYGLIQSLIYKLIESKRQNQSRCQCIQAVTDALLAYQEQFPDLQTIMVETGIVAVSSNLLPTPFGQFAPQC